MAEGTRLIRKFSVPGVNGMALPKDSPEDWALFKAYNKWDVEVEMEIRKALSHSLYLRISGMSITGTRPSMTGESLLTGILWSPPWPWGNGRRKKSPSASSR